MIVCEKVHEAEDDAKGLLHAQETVEGPFTVELEDWFAVRRVAGEACVCYDVLTGVVAFRGAVPEEETVLESWERSVESRVSEAKGFSQIEGPSGPQLV